MNKSKLRTAGAFGKIDSAALHPDLVRKNENYYSDCAVIRFELKQLLAFHLGIKHRLFILNNTTHGLLTTIVGLCAEGFGLKPANNAYAPYRILAAGGLPGGDERILTLQTHIDPTTGCVAPPLLEAGKPSVCDIAQSFATAAHHEAALAADVFICPLHKHTGLATGLGLLGISDELDAPHLRAVAEMAEAGTVAFPTIRKALARAQLLEGRVINTFALQMDEAQAQELSTDGVSILSPLNQPLPFAVLRVADPEILHKIPFRSPFTIKQLSGERMIRVSGAIRGVLGDAPVDHSARLASVIRRAANPGGGLGR